MIKKVDVCVNFFGKPYQTAVTIKSLWKHSSKHIGKIYLIIEKVQPHGDYGGEILLRYLLKDLPVVYFTPKYFYALGTPPEELLSEPEHRYGLNFQYAIEHTDKGFIFLSHNDCVYNDDLLGKMLRRIESEDENRIAGIGLIGQCWNCPALAAGVCDNSRFEEFVPTSAELEALIDQYKPPRESFHRTHLAAGKVHPLPECRLNEHACLINVRLYNQNVRPNGPAMPLGGNWSGADTGCVWFYDMYNLGYKFINYAFEPDMIHAPFADSGSGTKGDKNLKEYKRIEALALDYLKEHNYYEDIPGILRIKKSAYVIRGILRNVIARLLRQ